MTCCNVNYDYFFNGKVYMEMSLLQSCYYFFNLLTDWIFISNEFIQVISNIIHNFVEHNKSPGTKLIYFCNIDTRNASEDTFLGYLIGLSIIDLF